MLPASACRETFRDTRARRLSPALRAAAGALRARLALFERKDLVERSDFGELLLQSSPRGDGLGEPAELADENPIASAVPRLDREDVHLVAERLEALAASLRFLTSRVRARVHGVGGPRAPLG